jgi:hypothetical protein
VSAGGGPHALAMAALLPVRTGVTPHLLDGEGHLSVGVGATDRMFADLAATLA